MKPHVDESTYIYLHIQYKVYFHKIIRLHQMKPLIEERIYISVYLFLLTILQVITIFANYLKFKGDWPDHNH